MIDEADRVETLYDTTLQPRIAALEGLRLSLRSYMLKRGLLIGVPAVIFAFRNVVGLLLPEAWAPLLAGVSFVGILVGAVIVGMRYLLPGMTAYANYKAKFKQDVVAEIFKVVCPTAKYAPHASPRPSSTTRASSARADRTRPTIASAAASGARRSRRAM